VDPLRLCVVCATVGSEPGPPHCKRFCNRHLVTTHICGGGLRLRNSTRGVVWLTETVMEMDLCCRVY
jgi:hypothetical protein